MKKNLTRAPSQWECYLFFYLVMPLKFTSVWMTSRSLLSKGSGSSILKFLPNRSSCHVTLTYLTVLGVQYGWLLPASSTSNNNCIFATIAASAEIISSSLSHFIFLVFLVGLLQWPSRPFSSFFPREFSNLKQRAVVSLEWILGTSHGSPSTMRATFKVTALTRTSRMVAGLLLTSFCSFKHVERVHFHPLHVDFSFFY